MGDLPFNLSTMHWHTWAIPLAGLTSAGLTLVMGRALFRRRRQTAAPDANKLCMDPFVHGSANERRTSLRRTGKHIKVLVSNAGTDAPPEQGYIVDRSLGGICFSFPRELPENSELNIRAVDASSDCPWIKVQVKRCEKGEEVDWEIGCQFVKTPTWASLLQFG
jgi:hypothetical protein